MCRCCSGSGGSQASRGSEPNELAKIGIGAWIAVASNLILVGAILVSGNAPVHPIWPFLYSTGLGISFIYYWPTLLALVSRAAPAKMNATLMGLAFMSLFISNSLIGWIGGFYEKMTPARFGGCTRPSLPVEAFLLCYSAAASAERFTRRNRRLPWFRFSVPFSPFGGLGWAVSSRLCGSSPVSYFHFLLLPPVRPNDAADTIGAAGDRTKMFFFRHCVIRRHRHRE